MTDHARIRLPLQTGGGSLAALLWMAMTWTATFGAACFGIALLTIVHRGQEESKMIYVAIALPILCALAFGHATRMLFAEYRKQRASDVEIEERELRFVHGSADGSSIPWNDIESCTITTDTTRYVSTTSGGRTTTEYNDQLWLKRRRSEPQLLAESVDPEEKASLAELRQVILGACEARGGPASEYGGDEAGSVSVLQCGACGSPVSPADEQSTKCGACNAVVGFDADVREKIRSAATLSVANERLESVIQKLLDQPPAPAANRPLDLLGFLILAVPSLAILLYFAPAPLGGLARGFLVLFVGVPLAIAIAFLARLVVIERQALRSLTTGMGARNPLHAGEPPRCRQCGGTLFVRDKHVIAICLFCRAENLLGLDLRPAVAATQTRNYELAAILAKRHDQRQRAFSGLVVSGALAAGVALLAAISAM